MRPRQAHGTRYVSGAGEAGHDGNCGCSLNWSVGTSRTDTAKRLTSRSGRQGSCPWEWCLSVVHEGGEVRHLGDLTPLVARRLGVVLDEGGADEGGNHAPALAAGV